MNLHYMHTALGDSLGFNELSTACALSVADLQELIEYGALAPLQPAPTEPLFAISYLEPLRLASIARRDYDLDLFVVVILMDYLQRIAQLESQLSALQAQSGLSH
jgi:chaperone modulatory protein CbpM